MTSSSSGQVPPVTPRQSIPHGQDSTPWSLLSGHAVLPAAERTDIYLTALGIVLTLIYAVGLLFRPRRRIARLGVDSLAVLTLYGLGMIGLFTVSNMR